ncbi:transposase [Patescibacteria group bacterium]
MRKFELVNNEIYHLCNRSVEGKKIFIKEQDCVYFLKTLFAVNTTAQLPVNWRRDLFTVRMGEILNNGKPLVKFYALILMPDHFHVLVEQLEENGISRVMQRTCNSFAKYFNTKYNRKGCLFQGRFKGVPMLFDNQASHIMTYIHGNALDLFDLGWREGEIMDWTNAKNFLKEYQWSSLGIFTKSGIVNPLIRKFIDDGFGGTYHSKPKDFLNEIKHWSMRAQENFDSEICFLE